MVDKLPITDVWTKLVEGKSRRSRVIDRKPFDPGDLDLRP